MGSSIPTKILKWNFLPQSQRVIILEAPKCQECYYFCYTGAVTRAPQSEGLMKACDEPVALTGTSPHVASFNGPVRYVLISILQTGKLRLRKAKPLLQCQMEVWG